MKRTKKHLKQSRWILGGIAGLSVVLAGFFWSDPSLATKHGAWVKNVHGVWVSAGSPTLVPAEVRQQQFLIGEAILAYAVYKDAHRDLSAGPCLGSIFHGWVADIVHVPRQAIDDLQENQCESFLNGESPHVVELSIVGDVVSVR
ncbi:MAG: hypothetical protein V1778_03190 [bacterium]